MKSFIALFLALFVPLTAFASDNGYKVTYDGGSIQNVKSGASLKLFVEPATVRMTDGKADLVAIPANALRRSPTARMCIAVSEPPSDSPSSPSA